MDHPDVIWCERTGYPRGNQPVEEFCEVCGVNMDSKTIYRDEEYECLCDRCLLERHERDAIW